MLDINTNQVVRTLGSGGELIHDNRYIAFVLSQGRTFDCACAEANERFLAVALYQGTPKVDTQMLLARQANKVLIHLFQPAEGINRDNVDTCRQEQSPKQQKKF